MGFFMENANVLFYQLNLKSNYRSRSLSLKTRIQAITESTIYFQSNNTTFEP
jgi:hypothetical protein